MDEVMESRETSKENVKENVKERILQIMNREGLKAAAFADNINVAQATLSQILRGRNMPSMDFLLRLRQRYPDVSLDWLLTGEGIMSESPANAETVTSSSLDMNNEDYPLSSRPQRLVRRNFQKGHSALLYKKYILVMG